MVQAMTGGGVVGGLPSQNVLTLIALALALALQPFSAQEFVERFLRPVSILGVATAAVLVFVALEVGKGQPQSFIYFQF